MGEANTIKAPSGARWFVRESRPYDFLYDQTYTLPAREDFLAALRYGTRTGAKKKIHPVFSSMFSDIKKDIRNEGCLAPMKPDVIENFVHQYDVNGMPIIPADTGPLPVPRLVDDVTGAERYKYAMRYGTPQYKLDIQDQDPNADDQANLDLMQYKYDGEKRTVSKSIQTDYRESECQTDPYSPPYFLPYPGAYPRLLALVKLTWEKGLPFSLNDIIIIERALSKRMLEHEGQAIEDEKEFENRIKLMEELEAQQWADRENELERLCQRKMELTSRLLQEYSSRVVNDHTLRLERLHDKLKAKSLDSFHNIRHEYFRDIRKLERKYLQKQQPRERDIIKEYTNIDPKAYAAQATTIRNGEGPTEFTWDISDFDKIDKISKDPEFIRRELTFDAERFREKIEKCKPTGSTKRLEKKLEDIYLSFKDYGAKSKDLKNFLGAAQTLDQARPSTPEAELDEDPEVEWRKPHVVLLQKIARGRYAQKLIREEMEKNMDEIMGLKRLHDLGPDCKPKEVVEPSDEDDDIYLDEEIMEKMITFLDNETARLMEERKIHALILMAERERLLKEASEGGRRYREEEMRKTNDEIFKQITGINQATVDLYLEEVFLESCDRTADEQSREYVKQMAATLTEALKTARLKTLSDFEQEELAADLVSGLMIPEVYRLSQKGRIDEAGRRFLKGSYRVTEAIFSAQPAASSITDEVHDVVEEHLERSRAAFDASIEFVDIVAPAAAAKAHPPPPQPAVRFEEAGASKRSSEESVEEEEETRPPTEPSPTLTIQVSPEVIRSMAAKSVQLTYGTETGEAVNAAYGGAQITLLDVLEEVQEVLAPKPPPPPPPEDDSASDATLSDDPDDYLLNI